MRRLATVSRGCGDGAVAWYLNRGGEKIEGPFDEATLLSAIASGLPEEVIINETGSEQWAPLGSVPRFSRALRHRENRAMATQEIAALDVAAAKALPAALPVKRSVPPPVPARAPATRQERAAVWPRVLQGLVAAASVAVLAGSAVAAVSALSPPPVARLEHSTEAVRDTVPQVREVAAWGIGAPAFIEHGSSTADDAHFVLTNGHDRMAMACVKGVVTSKATGTKVESIVVCTGLVAPYTTVDLRAPYRVGAVLEICNEPHPIFGKRLDWSKCSFAMTDVTPRGHLRIGHSRSL